MYIIQFISYNYDFTCNSAVLTTVMGRHGVYNKHHNSDVKHFPNI